MGLYKETIRDNGMPLNYHRVASVNIITNQLILIELNSYPTQEMWNFQKENPEKIDEITVWQKMYDIPYQESFGVKEAYEYVKQQPEFKGAIDC